MVTMRDSYTSGGSTCDLRWVENKAIRFYMSLLIRQFVELFHEAINVITLTCLTVSVDVVGDSDLWFLLTILFVLECFAL